MWINTGILRDFLNYISPMIIGNATNHIQQFKELIKLHNHYESNDTSSQRALAFASAAWHLIEWVLKETNPKPSSKQLEEFRKTLYSKCPYLEMMHDITNTNKHRYLSNPKSNLSLVRKQGSVFTGAFSNAFGGDSLILEMENGVKMKFVDVANQILCFWLTYYREVLNIPSEQLTIKMNDYFI